MSASGPILLQKSFCIIDHEIFELYRIKSIVEKHERVAPESELTVSKAVFA